MKGAKDIIDLLSQYPHKAFRRVTLMDFAGVSDTQVERITAMLVETGFAVEVKGARSWPRYQRAPIVAKQQTRIDENVANPV